MASMLHGKSPEERAELERKLLSYTCGSWFHDMEDPGEGGIFDIVYVNDKLTCKVPHGSALLCCLKRSVVLRLW